MLRKLWLLVLVSISFLGQSQSLDPVESEIEHDDEYAQSWKVVIGPGASETKKAFKNYMKNRYDVKMKGIGLFSNKDVMSAKDIIISSISSKRINFYISVLDIEGLTELNIYSNYGDSAFFDKTNFNEEYSGLKTVLINFIKSYLPEYHRDIVGKSQEKYDEFIENRAGLEKNISKNKKQINDLKREIEELQRDLEKNETEIKQSKKNFEETQSQFDKLKTKLSKVK